ncbi:MAG: hypothetical protein NC340_10030 [Ruminococcus flavefaciens]|nr:hypothetical protein [Ruminococcus flavefaciens]MCM1229830.1 hypothetical protein [Ruminococcus flavefaciens]
MMTIRKENFIMFAEDMQTSVVRADIDVDTVSELPGVASISGRILHQGSVAYVIKSGEFYVLAGDGNWYSSEGVN